MRAFSALLKSLCVILCVLPLILSIRTAHAEGTFIAAGGRIDMVHNFDSNIVYITNGTAILRYNVATNTTVDRVLIDGGAANLMGIDISPDNKTLAVADNRTSGGQVWFWLIDTQTMQATKVAFPQAFYEGGTFTVAFGADGSVFVTSTFQGSGSVPFRRYFPATNTSTVMIERMSQNSMLTPSGDASIIGFAESNSSDGPVGRVRVSDGDVILRDGYEYGTSWFNYEIGTNRNGTQFAVPTYNGAYIHDSDVLKTGTKIGTYAGQHPMGVVYHPVEDLVYFAWATTAFVRAYNANTWAHTATYNFENTFDHPGNHAFKEGRLRISRDGSLLFATVANGVRFLKLYEGLKTQDQNVTVDENSSMDIALDGTIGNGGQLTWEIATPPAHGSLSGPAPSVSYTPEEGYSGTDSFTYRVSYGRASRMATVFITVNDVGSPPDAVDDSAGSTDGAPVTVSVLANDTDPDGDPLTVTEVTQGAKGSVTINADNTVTYSPQVAFTGTDSFTYKIGDGAGGYDTATVTITSTFDTAGLLYSLAVSPSTIAGGAIGKGTVKLSRPLSLPIEVPLNSTNSAASVPANAVVPAGSLIGTFAVTTAPVGAKTSGYIQATLGDTTKQALIHVRPVSVKSLKFTPSSVVGGRAAVGTVTLEAAAGPGDVTVTLTSLSGPAHVTDADGNPITEILIPAGESIGTFRVETDPVAAITKAKVRAAANGRYKDGILTVKPIPIASLKVSPSTIQGGNTIQAVVTLLDAAAPGDVSVTLTTSNPAVAWFVDSTGQPTSTLVVPAGAKTAYVAVRTASVAGKTTVGLKASAGGVTKSATLTVTL